MTRRQFMASAAAAGIAAGAPSAGRPQICIFSKHLGKLNYDQLGRVTREMGFDGVDLTVRPGGHVLPERVAEDLPRAVDAIRAHGVDVPMITTGITSAAGPHVREILATAAKLKIKYYKLGYWMFGKGDPDADVARVRAEAERLVALGKSYGIVAGFHNHSGDYVGYEVRDIREIIRGLDPAYIGYYFDACHATIEGGLAGWDIAQRIALKQLKLAAMKDAFWEKKDGKWDVHWCPMGEGMVNWPKVLAAYAKAGFTGPMSIHVEYEPADEIPATARDLAFLKKQVAAAYGKI
ncbi:MAG: sugar phosphate isomerase/epimerase family protein [Acidobacteriota bacterium]